MRRKPIQALILALIIIGLCASGCEKISCIDGNGDLQWENRSIDDFHAVSSEGSFNVTIIQDTFTAVDIEAESNLLPYFSTRTEDGVMVIRQRDQRCLNNTKPITVIVRTPVLEGVYLEGSGEIDAGDVDTEEMDISVSGSGDIRLGLLDCDFLDARITGSGNVYLSGKNTESELAIAGTGNIYAAGLEQETVFANISGAGNMHLWVTKFLDVKISGSGNIYYTGNPTINITITGSGSLIHN